MQHPAEGGVDNRHEMGRSMIASPRNILDPHRINYLFFCLAYICTTIWGVFLTLMLLERTFWQAQCNVKTLEIEGVRVKPSNNTYLPPSKFVRIEVVPAYVIITRPSKLPRAIKANVLSALENNKYMYLS